MATYNFTIRATDTAGAFADRSFSINVNNTTLDRFVVVGTLGLARSVDGVTWKYEPGRGGTHVTYGNGRWVVWDAGQTGTTTTLHTSPDGVNWSTTGLTNSAASSGFSLNSWKTGNQGFSTLKYLNGRWVAFTYNANNTSSSAAIQCYESADLVTWTVRGDVQTNTNTSFYAGVTDVVYGNGLYIAVGGYQSTSSNVSKAIWTSPDLTTWTRRVLTSSNGSNASGGATIVNINGLFVATTNNVANTADNVMTSPDGTTWTNRGVATAALGLAYVNGRIFCQMSNQIYRSLDAGATWTALSGGVALPVQAMANVLTGNTMAAYGNTVFVAYHKSTAPQTVYRYTADGVANGSVSLDSMIGVTRSVAARP